MWWEGKLRSILNRLADQKYNGSYLKALQALSHRIGMIELVPYHSGESPSGRILRDLPSVAAAKNYVQETLLTEAKIGKKLLIVMRQTKGWGVSQASKNVIIYGKHEARGASLSPDSRGGAAILRRLEVR